jgi:hypothetical protein
LASRKRVFVTTKSLINYSRRQELILNPLLNSLNRYFSTGYISRRRGLEARRRKRPSGKSFIACCLLALDFVYKTLALWHLSSWQNFSFDTAWESLAKKNFYGAYDTNNEGHTTSGFKD